ncbi:MAG TPA: MerR family transcriptional regulator, partial [Thiohalobacter sp.]|nr:MerR family transcriptional regulator [Thiohalobacter sp.]
LYEQGFTIGGARQRLSGDEAKDDINQSQQIIRQMRMELEELLHILKR